MSADGREATLYRWARRALIALGLIGVLGALALAIGLAILSWNRPRFEPAKVETADRKRGFTIGDVSAVAGTPLVRINISESEGSAGSYSYSRDDLRNVLVLDSATGRSWRLMPANDRRISRASWLPAAATGPSGESGDDMVTIADDGDRRNRPQPPDAYFLFLVERGDGTFDLVTGTIDGSRRGTPLQQIQGVDSSWMRDPTHLAVIVREQGQLFYRIVDMATFHIVSSRPIPIDR